MKVFSKKIIFIIVSFVIVLCFIVYFLKFDHSESFSINEFYISDVANIQESNQEYIIVHVDGEVNSPGIISIPKNSRISDAINAAGGSTPFIDISKINLAYILKDGQKIYVPSIYDSNINYIQDSAGENIVIPDSNSSPNIVNINSATKSELETLPGIGSSTASKIINYRETNGNFKSVEELMNISGIGESKFNNFKDFISI